MTPNNQEAPAQRKIIDIAAFRKKNKLNLQDIADILGWSRSSVKLEEESRGWRRLFPEEIKKIFDTAETNGWDTDPLNSAFARLKQVLRYIEDKGMTAEVITDEILYNVKYGETGISDNLAWSLSCLRPELDVEWMKTGEGSMISPDTGKWINANVAADILGVSTQTIRNYAKKGVLHVRETHSLSYYPLAEVKALAGYGKFQSVEQIRQQIDSIETEMNERLVITKEQYKSRVKEFHAFLSDNDKSWYSFHFFISKTLNAIFRNNLSLKEKEWKVINGLLDLKSLQQVADDMGITRERVRQIALKVCHKIATISYRKMEEPAPKSETSTPRPAVVETKEYHIGEFERFMLSPFRQYDAYRTSPKLSEKFRYYQIVTVEDLFIKGKKILENHKLGKRIRKELEEIVNKIGNDIHTYGYESPRECPHKKTDLPNELLDSPMDKHFSISTRLKNVFKTLKVVTIRDLVKLNKETLHSTRGIGENSLREFDQMRKTILQKLGEAIVSQMNTSSNENSL
jgi:Bacterial RNA polymerase, alpha chain C terminal domain./Sigma-70, region 4.